MGVGSSKFDASKIENSKSLNKYVQRMQKLMNEITKIKTNVDYTNGWDGRSGQFASFNKINSQKKKRLDQLEAELYTLIDLMEGTKKRLVKIGTGLATIKREVGKNASGHALFAQNYHTEKATRFQKLGQNMAGELSGDYTKALTDAFSAEMKKGATRMLPNPPPIATYRPANKKKTTIKKK